MGLIAIPPVVYPRLPVTGFSAAGLIDASAEKIAAILQAPKSGNLKRFEFRLGTVTQAPASGLLCSFQNVSAKWPDGTLDQSATVTAGLSSSSWVIPPDFSALRAVTKGDAIAAVIQFAAWAAGDALVISTASESGFTPLPSRPYTGLFTSSWAAISGGNRPILALVYEDDSIPSLAHADIYPSLAFSTTILTSASTPDQAGARFSLPFPCELTGAWFRLTIPDAARTFNVRLYDASDTLLATTPGDPASILLTTADNLSLEFPTPITLAANTVYRLVLIATTTGGVSLGWATTPSAAHMAAFDGGAAFHWTERTGAGAWTDTATRRPTLGLHLSMLHDGTGIAAGGGPLVGSRLTMGG